MNDDLFFKPWLGRYYEPFDLDRFTTHPPGLYPMHLLGESHYGSPDEYGPDFTAKVIRECGMAPTRGPFFRNIVSTLTGTAPEPRDYAGVWDWLGFSNYIQTFLDGPRQRPTPEMWDRAGRAFPAFLVRYKPDSLLVLGQDLWRHLDKSAGFRIAAQQVDDVLVDDAHILTWEDDAGLRWTVAMHILHPSAPAFDVRKARLRVGILRALIDNIDVTGRHMTFEEQRARISA